MAVPTYVGTTGQASTGSPGSCPYPSGVQTNDIIVLAIEDDVGTIGTPSGWTAFADSPQTSGGSTKIHVFWKRYTAADANPSFTGFSNHYLARTFAIRGCPTSGDPFDVTAGSTDGGAPSTTLTIAGDTTTVADCLVLLIAADGVDSNATRVSGEANADLTSLTERLDSGTTTGNGGGLVAYTGVKATAGAFGSTTATYTSSRPYAAITIAFKPAIVETLAVPFIAAATTLYALALTPAIPVPFVSTVSVLYVPALSGTGSATLALPHVAEATFVYAPTFQTGQLLTVPNIASATALYALTLSGTGAAPLAVPTIASATIVRTPTFTGPQVIAVPFIGARAVLTTAISGINNDLTFTAVKGGTDGNAITVRYIVAVDSGGTAIASQPLFVEVAGNEIIVYLATDAAGAVTSTASQVLSAIQASAPASYLVTVALAPSNTGAGVVASLASTALTGGTGTVTSVIIAPSTYYQPWGAGAIAVVGPGGTRAQAIYQLELADRFGGVLSDITTITFDKKGEYRINRPSAWSFRVPLHLAQVRTVHSDGRPYLCAGYRALKVRRNGRLVFHGFVWRVTRQGDKNDAWATVLCLDPMTWWRFRVVRDATGDFSTPTFATPISGPEIVQQMIQNSISNTAGVANPGQQEGPLGVTVGSITPGLDLSSQLIDWPVTMGEMATMLTETGIVDIRVNPTDGVPGIMGTVDSAPRIGSDLSGSVHFDYATGDHSVDQCEHTHDMETLCNKLWWELGPKESSGPPGPARWHSNITGDDKYLPNKAAIKALTSASRAALGTFMEHRIMDETGLETERDFEATYRKLLRRLWEGEAKIRYKPRELLKITPSAAAPYQPFDNYNPGDNVGVNVGDALGITISGSQVCYGFDVMPDGEGVERMSSLVTSADQS